jgi:dihydroorotate dehydrogenase
MEIYQDLAKPILKHIHSETGHHLGRTALNIAGQTELGLFALRKAVLGNEDSVEDPRLATDIGNVHFTKFALVAAGWDKIGVAGPAWKRLGAGGEVLGGVLKWDQPGNDLDPRQWYDEFDTPIGPVFFSQNFLALPTPGVSRVKRNLRHRQIPGFPYIANVAANHWLTTDQGIADNIADTVQILAPAVSGYELCVSCPNAEDTAKQQAKDKMERIGYTVKNRLARIGREDLIVGVKTGKLGFDLSSTTLDGIIYAVEKTGLDFYSTTNTSLDPAIRKSYGHVIFKRPGGASGNDPRLVNKAHQTMEYILTHQNEDKPIMGVSGVYDYKTALEWIILGAQAVQLNTGIRFIGPRVFHEINRDSVRWFDQHGVKSLDQIRSQRHYLPALDEPLAA